MSERKMYALLPSDAVRVDELMSLVNVELEKLGRKKSNRTTILRALIFSAHKITTEDLIKGVTQAQTIA
ncbi:MAG: hypothetical protein Q8L78_09370 [Coxiellaceae bacterium]|nr:hypothetical protein [Coxiellaceae bacterium]